MVNTYSISPPDFGYFQVVATHSGQHIHLSLNSNTVDDLRWLSDFRKKAEDDTKLRDSNPALAATWDSYQTMLRLVTDVV